jgi:hypothetical protein
MNAGSRLMRGSGGRRWAGAVFGTRGLLLIRSVFRPEAPTVGARPEAFAAIAHRRHRTAGKLDGRQIGQARSEREAVLARGAFVQRLRDLVDRPSDAAERSAPERWLSPTALK